jgi:sec-independent protein translocase protein TatA
MPNIGWPELVIVLVIALLVFGPKKLPEMGRSLGKGIREFRQATSGIKDELDLGLNEPVETPAVTAGTTEPAQSEPIAAATVAAAAVTATAPETEGSAAGAPAEPGEPAPVDFTPPPANDPEGEAAALAAYGIDAEGNPVGDRHVDQPVAPPTIYIDADGNEYHLTAPAVGSAADAAQSNQAADEAPDNAPDGTSDVTGA